MPTFHYTVNEEPQSTDKHVLTPVQIMSKAGIAPGSNYLILLEGKKKKSYENDPDAEVHMRQNMKFITVFTGETPVAN